MQRFQAAFFYHACLDDFCLELKTAAKSNAFAKFRDGYFERFCNSADDPKRWILLAALDSSHIRTIKSGNRCKFLLGPATKTPQLADSLSKPFIERFFRFHALTVRLSRAIYPRVITRKTLPFFAKY